MIDLDALEEDLTHSALAPQAERLCGLLSKVLSELKHGDQPRWDAALKSLPAITEPWKSRCDLDTVTVGDSHSLNAEQLTNLESSLREFMPWRKGPYSIGGIKINTEWRSDWKWQRLADHIQPLAGRAVLDVGCGNGYHLWRMRAAGASLAIGIDPSLLFLYQFNVLNHFIDARNIHFLPLRSEQLPSRLASFDTVFSMGVLYHRRDPEQHLLELLDCLRPDGELVLETLVSPSDEPIQLEAGQRYARMRNVWSLPTIDQLTACLSHCGFNSVQLISENQTSIKEQRTTDWMPFESLEESLMPGNPERTIEGYPGPKRAILCAKRPN